MSDDPLISFGAETVGVQLTRDVVSVIENEAISSSGRETGGVLIGHYNAEGNVALVSMATARPADSRSGRAWFQRGIIGLRELLRAQWRSGHYYLGEWHSHPGGAPHPSSSDIREMCSIARDVSYRCPKPIMVIAGTSGPSVTLSVSVLENERLLILRRRPEAAEGRTAEVRIHMASSLGIS